LKTVGNVPNRVYSKFIRHLSPTTVEQLDKDDFVKLFNSGSCSKTSFQLLSCWKITLHRL